LTRLSCFCWYYTPFIHFSTPLGELLLMAQLPVHSFVYPPFPLQFSYPSVSLSLLFMFPPPHSFLHSLLLSLSPWYPSFIHSRDVWCLVTGCVTPRAHVLLLN